MKVFVIKNAIDILDTLKKLEFNVKSFNGSLGKSFIAEREQSIILMGINTKYITIENFGKNKYEVVFTDDKNIFSHYYQGILEMLQQYEYDNYCEKLKKVGLAPILEV